MLNDATGFNRIFIKVGYTDLRCGIDGLVAMIKNGFRMDPFEQGNIFLFCGRRNDRIKALLFEGDGFLLLYKRLSNGKFQWPRNEDEVKEVSPQQYRWLMEGLRIEQKQQISMKTPSRT